MASNRTPSPFAWLDLIQDRNTATRLGGKSTHGAYRADEPSVEKTDPGWTIGGGVRSIMVLAASHESAYGGSEGSGIGPAVRRAVMESSSPDSASTSHSARAPISDAVFLISIPSRSVT